MSIKIQADSKIDKLILKLIWKLKRHRRPKAILKNNKVGGLIRPNFKTVQSYNSQVESPEINLYIYMITNFQKGCQDNSIKKRSFQ